MQEKLKNTKGITLVALIITVIILLILAGVTISLVIGDNGLITKSKQGVEESEMASIKEQAELTLDDLEFDHVLKDTNVNTLTQLKKLNSAFDGSYLQGNKVVVNNEKYDIYLKNPTTVLVKKHPKVKNGDLIVVYDVNQYSEENTNISIYVSIAGLNADYKSFAEEKLNGKLPEEKEQMFLESYKYLNNINEKITVEQLFSKLSEQYNYKITSLEELVDYFNNQSRPPQSPSPQSIGSKGNYTNSNSSIKYASLNNKLVADLPYAEYETSQKRYENVDDFLIESYCVCPEEFDNIADIYNSIEVKDQDGNIVNAGGYGKYEYVAGENKKYTFTITYEDKKEVIEVDITGIIQVFTGNGTANSPYIIDSIEGLVSLSKRVDEGKSIGGCYFKLARDLDFNDDSSYLDPSTTRYGDINEDGKVESIKKETTTGKGFNPIGSTDSWNAKFTGVFDGNGKEIKNLHINDNTRNTGLFARCEYAKIKNLGISGEVSGGGNVGAVVGGTTNVEITNCYSSANIISDPSLQSDYISRNYAGGIVGYASVNNVITECYNTGTVYSTNTKEYTYAGGIAGLAGAEITNCYNTGNITANGADFTYAGGISGEGGDVDGCYNTGNITTQKIPSDKFVSFVAGGIVGGAHAYIYNCYNTGNITSAKTAGGITGVSYTTISNCYNIGSVTGECGVGGIVYQAGECVQNCYNNGFVKTNDSSYTMSGIATYVADTTGMVDNCYSEGTFYDFDTRGITYTLINNYEGSITNCWYKKGTAPLGVASREDSEGFCTSSDTMPVTVLEVLNKLTTNITKAKFKADTGINNGYPILSWQ